MNSLVPQINLVSAWIGMVLGIASGFGLGLKFHEENWLGGYTSLKRRLYRLGHISFFGLAMVNIIFYLTVRHSGLLGNGIVCAAWLLLAGAVTMPLACALMANKPSLRPIFLVPVSSLGAGAVLTLWKVISL